MSDRTTKRCDDERDALLWELCELLNCDGPGIVGAVKTLQARTGRLAGIARDLVERDPWESGPNGSLASMQCIHCGWYRHMGRHHATCPWGRAEAEQ